MKFGIVQYNPVWEDKISNQEKLASMLGSVPADLCALIFPEMTLTGFSMNVNELAEEIEGHSSSFFRSIAAENNVHVFAGIIEKQNGKFFNSLLHINTSGEITKVYRKIHPFSYSDENKHYSRGEETVITQIEEWKSGLSICYDLRFPELFRRYALDRVNLIINIANWPDTRIEHWKTLLKARAIENQCYVIGVNRVGNDPRLNYTGDSLVYDAMGNIIAAAYDEEQILFADLIPENVEEVRNNLPFLSDIFLIK